MKKVEKSFCCINIWFVSPHTKQVVCCPHQNHPPTNWGAALINRVGDKFHQINWMDIIVLSIQLRSIRSKINTWTKTDRFQNAQTFGQINESMKYFQLLSKHISTFWCRYQHSFYSFSWSENTWAREVNFLNSQVSSSDQFLGRFLLQCVAPFNVL